MDRIDRRELLAVAGAGIAVAAGMGAGSAQAQTASAVNAFATDAELKPLPYGAGDLEGFSERLISSHWQNNYGGSVRALNAVKGRIREALDDDAIPAYVYNDLKREHLLRTGSVVLHEYYFDNMAPPGQRDSALDRELVRAFGSVAIWEKEFRRIGAGLGGGSGWVMLAWNHHLQTLENYWMWDHMHAPVDSSPILVMDMYEHSYQMDYGAATADYINAFMNNTNWSVAAGRLDQALRG